MRSFISFSPWASSRRYSTLLKLSNFKNSLKSGAKSGLAIVQLAQKFHGPQTRPRRLRLPEGQVVTQRFGRSHRQGPAMDARFPGYGFWHGAARNKPLTNSDFRSLEDFGSLLTGQRREFASPDSRHARLRVTAS